MPPTPDGNDPRELAAITRSQAKRVRREATILVQLSARLEEALTTDDSPKEGTRTNDRDRTDQA